jgi:hypothetical protein
VESGRGEKIIRLITPIQDQTRQLLKIERTSKSAKNHAYKMKAIKSVTPRPSDGSRRLICILQLSPVTDLFTKFSDFFPRPFVKFPHFSIHSPVRFLRLAATTNALHTDFPFFPSKLLLQFTKPLTALINHEAFLFCFSDQVIYGASFFRQFLEIKNDFQIDVYSNCSRQSRAFQWFKVSKLRSQPKLRS